MQEEGGDRAVESTVQGEMGKRGWKGVEWVVEVLAQIEAGEGGRELRNTLIEVIGERDGDRGREGVRWEVDGGG